MSVGVFVCRFLGVQVCISVFVRESVYVYMYLVYGNDYRISFFFKKKRTFPTASLVSCWNHSHTPKMANNVLRAFSSSLIRRAV